jgi:hypothetical protein
MTVAAGMAAFVPARRTTPAMAPALGLTTAVTADSAVPVPFSFVAVSRTRIV